MTLAIFKYAVIQADFQVPHIEFAIPILLTDQVVIVQQPIGDDMYMGHDNRGNSWNIYDDIRNNY